MSGRHMRAWSKAKDQVQRMVAAGKVRCSCGEEEHAKLCNITVAIDQQMDIELDHMEDERCDS